MSLHCGHRAINSSNHGDPYFIWNTLSITWVMNTFVAIVREVQYLLTDVHFMPSVWPNDIICKLSFSRTANARCIHSYWREEVWGHLSLAINWHLQYSQLSLVWTPSFFIILSINWIFRISEHSLGWQRILKLNLINLLHNFSNSFCLFSQNSDVFSSFSNVQSISVIIICSKLTLGL